MTVLQAAALIVVAITGTAVALIPVPIRQTLMLAIFGFALTVLFFSFQAPDVALSEIVVSGVGLPLIILAALRRLADEGLEPDSGSGAPRGSGFADHEPDTDAGDGR